MEGADGTVGGCCVAATEEATGSGAGRFCGLVVACGAACAYLVLCKDGGESDVSQS